MYHSVCQHVASEDRELPMMDQRTLVVFLAAADTLLCTAGLQQSTAMHRCWAAGLELLVQPPPYSRRWMGMLSRLQHRHECLRLHRGSSASQQDQPAVSKLRTCPAAQPGVVPLAC